MDCEKQKECLLSEARSHVTNIVTFEADILNREAEIVQIEGLVKDYKLKLEIVLDKLSKLDDSVNWRDEFGEEQ